MKKKIYDAEIQLLEYFIATIKDERVTYQLEMEKRALMDFRNGLTASHFDYLTWDQLN